MKKLHSKEKQQFRDLFLQEQIDRFEDRYRILDVFLQTEHHVTIDELVQVLAQAGHRFPVQFVEDTMDLMCRFGFAAKNRFGEGEYRFEHHHLGQHHDHMICTKCGGIFEFRNDRLEQLQLEIAKSHGFHLLQHRMELYGICDACREERVARMPLVGSRPGERVMIQEITGGPGARIRLLSMGLRIGDILEVITNFNDGQVVVALESKRYALGRGLAGKIVVSPANGG